MLFYLLFVESKMPAWCQVLALFVCISYATSGLTTEYAYATIVYGGTPRDTEYFIAARVMVRYSGKIFFSQIQLGSLKRTGTPFDRVAILYNVPEWFKDELRSDGVFIREVDTVFNPYVNQRYFSVCSAWNSF